MGPGFPPACQLGKMFVCVSPVRASETLRWARPPGLCVGDLAASLGWDRPTCVFENVCLRSLSGTDSPHSPGPGPE